MESYIYYSSDFQCPISGIPVWMQWNEETGRITAEICGPVWDDWKDELDVDETDTKTWCDKFHDYADTLEEANDIAEKYDCWF